MPSTKAKGKSLAGLFSKPNAQGQSNEALAAEKLKAGLALPFVLAPPSSDGKHAASAHEGKGGGEQGEWAVAARMEVFGCALQAWWLKRVCLNCFSICI